MSFQSFQIHQQVLLRRWFWIHLRLSHDFVLVSLVDLQVGALYHIHFSGLHNNSNLDYNKYGIKLLSEERVQITTQGQ